MSKVAFLPTDFKNHHENGWDMLYKYPTLTFMYAVLRVKCRFSDPDELCYFYGYSDETYLDQLYSV